jgi:hypothetical protein
MEQEKNQNEKMMTEKISAIEPQTDKAVLSESAIDNLAKTAKYMHIICIAYYIFGGIVCIGALMNLADLFQTQGEIFPRSSISLIVLRIGIAALMIFLGTYLQAMAGAYKKFGKNPHDLQLLESAFNPQKGFWKWIVVITIGIPCLSLFLFMIS